MLYSCRSNRRSLAHKMLVLALELTVQTVCGPLALVASLNLVCLTSVGGPLARLLACCCSTTQTRGPFKVASKEWLAIEILALLCACCVLCCVVLCLLCSVYWLLSCVLYPSECRLSCAETPRLSTRLHTTAPAIEASALVATYWPSGLLGWPKCSRP